MEYLAVFLTIFGCNMVYIEHIKLGMQQHEQLTGSTVLAVVASFAFASIMTVVFAVVYFVLELAEGLAHAG